MTVGHAAAHSQDEHFIFVATLAETEPGRSILRTINGVELLVCSVNRQIYVVENRCSHMRRPLGAGRLHGHLVTCPVHSAQFDVRDGSPKCFPASRPIRHFEVHMRGGEIWAKVPAA